jgi:hypothetical protein
MAMAWLRMGMLLDTVLVVHSPDGLVSAHGSMPHVSVVWWRY